MSDFRINFYFLTNKFKLFLISQNMIHKHLWISAIDFDAKESLMTKSGGPAKYTDCTSVKG